MNTNETKITIDNYDEKLSLADIVRILEANKQLKSLQLIKFRATDYIEKYAAEVAQFTHALASSNLKAIEFRGCYCLDTCSLNFSCLASLNKLLLTKKNLLRIYLPAYHLYDCTLQGLYDALIQHNGIIDLRFVKENFSVSIYNTWLKCILHKTQSCR